MLWMKLYILNGKVSPLHTFLIWIRVTSLVVTGLQSTKGRPEYFDSFGRPPQEKSQTFCIPVQKAGNTITYPFKNFIL